MPDTDTDAEAQGPMCVRTIVAYLVPGKADEAIRIFSEQVVPVIREQPGYVSTAIYLDRDNNMAQTVSMWESAEAQAATSQGTEYLTKVVGMLRGCLVNREVTNWEVGCFDRA
jgi:heme-degrading monooxygenase HmoA